MGMVCDILVWQLFEINARLLIRCVVRCWDGKEGLLIRRGVSVAD